MITRIVRMEFHPDRVDDFLKVFEANKNRIAGYPGCLRLELHRNISEPQTLYTISRWISEDALNDYRASELFLSTWKQTKIHFAAPAQAWSTTALFDSAEIK